MHFFFTSLELHVLMKGPLGRRSEKERISPSEWFSGGPELDTQEPWNQEFMDNECVSGGVWAARSSPQDLRPTTITAASRWSLRRNIVLNFQKQQNKNKKYGICCSSSEANPVAIFSSLCSAVRRPNPKILATDCDGPSVARTGPRASVERSEPDLLPVVFLLWPGRPQSPAPKMWWSVALMFCYASLILKITMALVEPWVALIWVACFASFFLLFFSFSSAISSQSSSFSLLGTNTS